MGAFGMGSFILSLLLCFWSVEIWFTWGLYREIFVGLLPLLFLFPLVKWNQRPRLLTGWNQSYWVIVILVVNLLLSVLQPLIMYPKEKSVELDVLRYWQLIAGGIMLAAFFLQQTSKKTVSRYLAWAACILFGLSLILIIPISPKPYIDVWYYSQLAVDAFVSGQNPYTISYPQMYDGVSGHFPYMPLVLLVLTPFKLLFGDVRATLIFALWVAAAALGWMSRQKEQRPWIMAAFLSSTANTFVVEQSWLDPISVGFLFTFLALIQKSKTWPALICLSGFLAVKQYNFLFLPFLFFAVFDFRRPRSWFLPAVVVLSTSLITALPFLILNAEAFVQRITSVPTMTAPNFLSLSNWLARRGLHIGNAFALGSTALLAIGGLYFQIREKWNLSRALQFCAILFLWLLVWYSNSAANYFWLVTAFLWCVFVLGPEAISRFQWLDATTGTFLLCRLAIIFAIPPFITDLGSYWEQGGRLVQMGQTPYVDYSIEYPPGVLLLFVPTWWLNLLSADRNWIFFRFCFHLINFAIEILFFLALRRRFGNPILCFYIILTMLLCTLLYDRLDLITGILMVTPLLFASAGWRRYLGWAAVYALGGLIKLVPVVLAPLYVLQREKLDLRKAPLFLIVAGFPLAAAIGWIAWNDPVNDVSFLSYHMHRGVNIDSVYSTAVLFAQEILGWKLGIGVTNNFGAFHLTNVKELKRLSVLGLPLAFLVTYLWVVFDWYKGRRRWWLWTWTLVLVFISANRVLSPQYLIWLILLAVPLLPELKDRLRNFWIGYFGLIVAMTALHFLFYFDFVALNKKLIVLLLLRNLMLLGLIPLTLLSYGPKKVKA